MEHGTPLLSNEDSLLGNSRKTSKNHLKPQSNNNPVKNERQDVNPDITIRSTKIVCTLGRNTRFEEPICKMIRKGMNVARINMNYFEIHEQNEMIQNIRSATIKTNKDVAIMIDLKGPLIRTLGFKDTMYSIPVKTGQEIRISTNRIWKGDENMFIIDYEHIDAKLVVGDKVLVDYGGVILTVIGFESEQKYLVNQQRKKKQKELQDSLLRESPDPSPLDQLKSEPLHHTENEEISEIKRNSSLDKSNFTTVASPLFMKTHTLTQDNDDIYGRRKEIEELVEEENIEDESSELHADDDLEKKDQMYPSVGRIEPQSHHQHKIIAEEVEQEQAIFNEVLKKQYQGYNAQKLSKLAERARITSKKNVSMNMNAQ